MAGPALARHWHLPSRAAQGTQAGHAPVLAPTKRVQKRVRQGGKVLCQRKSSAWCRKNRMQLPPDDRYAPRVPQFFVYVRIPVARHAADAAPARRTHRPERCRPKGWARSWAGAIPWASGMPAANAPPPSMPRWTSQCPTCHARWRCCMHCCRRWRRRQAFEIHYHADGLPTCATPSTTRAGCWRKPCPQSAAAATRPSSEGAAGRQGRQGVKRRHSRRFCEHLHRGRPPKPQRHAARPCVRNVLRDRSRENALSQLGGTVWDEST